MRNFQEEQANRSSASVASPSGPSWLPKQFRPKRRKYRALIGVFTVGIIVAAIVWVASTSGSYSSSTKAGSPRSIVVLVPGLSPVVLESAMASNKAPNLAMLSTFGGSYARVAVNTTDPTAALVTLLTGAPVSFHNVSGAAAISAMYHGAPSLPRYATIASLRTTLIASSKYYSRGVNTGAAGCATIGVLDVECVGQSCGGTDAASFCSATTKVVVPNDVTALMGTTVSSSFIDTVANRDLTVVLLSAFESLRLSDDSDLAALSAAALLDGLVGQIALVASKRSAQNDEKWLITVASDGVNLSGQAPFLVAAYKGGSLASLSPVSSSAGNIADVFSTTMAWFGVTAPAGVVGAVEAICNTAVLSC